jgi:type II secretory pathway pseudopilin PulG
MVSIFRAVAQRSQLYSIDEFGVKNYKKGFISLLGILIMIALTLFFGAITYQAEFGVEGATIQTFGDALWLMIMSSTTVGFGSQYPVTTIGRLMVTFMFIFGVGILGGLGGIIASKIFAFSDTNVRNRELRHQNENIYNKLLEVEALLKKNQKDKN